MQPQTFQAQPSTPAVVVSPPQILSADDCRIVIKQIVEDLNNVRSGGDVNNVAGKVSRYLEPYGFLRIGDNIIVPNSTNSDGTRVTVAQFLRDLVKPSEDSFHCQYFLGDDENWVSEALLAPENQSQYFFQHLLLAYFDSRTLAELRQRKDDVISAAALAADIPKAAEQAYLNAKVNSVAEKSPSAKESCKMRIYSLVNDKGRGALDEQNDQARIADLRKKYYGLDQYNKHYTDDGKLRPGMQDLPIKTSRHDRDWVDNDLLGEVFDKEMGDLLVSQAEREKKAAGATLIQRYWRGYLDRKKVAKGLGIKQEDLPKFLTSSEEEREKMRKEEKESEYPLPDDDGPVGEEEEDEFEREDGEVSNAAQLRPEKEDPRAWPRRIKVQNLRDEGLVESNREIFAIPQILGQLNRKDHSVGHQYENGLVILEYDNPNLLDRQVGDALRYCSPASEPIASIVRLNDDVRGDQYCVVVQSARGVSQNFVSPETVQEEILPMANASYRAAAIRAVVNRKFDDLDDHPLETMIKSLENWQARNPAVAATYQVLLSYLGSDKIKDDIQDKGFDSVMEGIRHHMVTNAAGFGVSHDKIDDLVAKTKQSLFDASTKEERDSARKVASHNTSRYLADRIEKSIQDNQYKLDLDNVEVISLSANNPRLLKTLKAAMPLSPFEGISILRHRGENTTCVTFNGTGKGNDIARVYIPETPECYQEVRRADHSGDFKVYVNGEMTVRHFEKGDIIMHPGTVFHRRPDGNYQPVGLTKTPNNISLLEEFGPSQAKAVWLLNHNFNVKAMCLDNEGHRHLSVMQAGQIVVSCAHLGKRAVQVESAQQGLGIATPPGQMSKDGSKTVQFSPGGYYFDPATDQALVPEYDRYFRDNKFARTGYCINDSTGNKVAEVGLLIRKKTAADNATQVLVAERAPYILAEDGSTYSVENPLTFEAGLKKILGPEYDPRKMQPPNGEYLLQRQALMNDCNKIKPVVDFGQGRHGVVDIGDPSSPIREIVAAQLGRTPEASGKVGPKTCRAHHVRGNGGVTAFSRDEEPIQVLAVGGGRGGR